MSQDLPTIGQNAGTESRVLFMKDVAVGDCGQTKLRWASKGVVPLLQEVARVALHLFEVHLAGTPQMRLQDDIHMHPYPHIMAVIVVAIKLVYRLDAENAQASQNNTEHNAVDWQSWADAVAGGCRGPTTFAKTALEVRALMSQVQT